MQCGMCESESGANGGIGRYRTYGRYEHVRLAEIIEAAESAQEEHRFRFCAWASVGSPENQNWTAKTLRPRNIIF